MNLENKEFDEEEIDIFDSLYEGRLSEDAFYEIKSRLQKDTLMQKRFLVYKLMRKEIENNSITSITLKDRFNRLNQKNKKKAKKTKSLLVSFVIIILLSLLTIYVTKDTSSSIYNKYKDSEAGLPIKMNKHNGENFDEAMIVIHDGDFKAALSILNKMPISDTTLFYKAYSHEMLGETAEASKIYEYLKQSSSKFIREKSEFRFVLLLIKNKNPDSMMELENLKNDSLHYYHEIITDLITVLGEK
jgi:hypothetical protein